MCDVRCVGLRLWRGTLGTCEKCGVKGCVREALEGG